MKPFVSGNDAPGRRKTHKESKIILLGFEEFDDAMPWLQKAVSSWIGDSFRLATTFRCQLMKLPPTTCSRTHQGVRATKNPSD
jgi:hypothetical protein